MEPRHTPAPIPPVPAELASLLSSYGAPELDGLTDSLSGEPAVAVRFNSRKPIALPTGLSPIEWCEQGLRLPVRPMFTMDPRIHQGVYYVQDPSSAYFRPLVASLASMLGNKPIAYLDACAAPGGKTTAAIDALPDGSAVVANEFDPKRASILRENIAKWGYPFVTLTRGDTSRFATFGPTFSIISADVPCSGEGMMRKDADARAQWTPQLTERCAALQRTIVANLWPALLPGGFFIYSTCTFNRAENEDNILWMKQTLGAEPVDTSILPTVEGASPAIDSRVSALRFMPHRLDGEGLFVAVLRKPASQLTGTTSHSPKKQKQKSPAKTSKAPAEVNAWLRPEINPTITVDADSTVTATFPTPLLPPQLYPTLTLGQLNGHDVIPSQQLALSLALNNASFPQIEIDRATAITYLRRDAITLPEGAPRGFVLLTYCGKPLGFVKNIGNRSNNLYPAEWRILSNPGPTLPPLPF